MIRFFLFSLFRFLWLFASLDSFFYCDFLQMRQSLDVLHASCIFVSHFEFRIFDHWSGTRSCLRKFSTFCQFTSASLPLHLHLSTPRHPTQFILSFLIYYLYPPVSFRRTCSLGTMQMSLIFSRKFSALILSFSLFSFESFVPAVLEQWLILLPVLLFSTRIQKGHEGLVNCIVCSLLSIGIARSSVASSVLLHWDSCSSLQEQLSAAVSDLSTVISRALHAFMITAGMFVDCHILSFRGSIFGFFCGLFFGFG